MSPYFYSLEMLITGRHVEGTMPLGMMDLLAEAIADEDTPPRRRLVDWIESCQKQRRR